MTFRMKALLVCALALVAPAISQADDMPTVKIGMIPVPVAQVFSAQAHGLFEKHGVNVELVKFTSGPAQFQALANGSIQIGEGAIAAFYMASTRGLNVKWVDSFGDYSPLEGLMLTPGSTATSIKDLAGKKVTSHTGSIQHLAHLHAMMENDMAVDASERVSLPPPQALPALINGDVDASWLFEPLISLAKARGATMLASYSDVGVEDPFGIAANTDWLEASPENRETLAKILAALDEGLEMHMQDPEPTIKAAMTFTGTSREVTEMIVNDLIWYSLEDNLTGPIAFTDPSDTTKGLPKVLNWIDEVATAGELIETSVALSDFIYSDAAAEAVK